LQPEDAAASFTSRNQHGNTDSLGHQLMWESQPLADHVLGESVEAGRVAARPGEASDKTKLEFLQISAPVQPENSGGPLLDRNGTVIGVVVAKLNALEVASATATKPKKGDPERVEWGARRRPSKGLHKRNR